MRISTNSTSANEPTLKDILKEIYEMKEKLKKMNGDFSHLDKKIDYLENEIKTIELTQNYICSVK